MKLNVEQLPDRYCPAVINVDRAILNPMPDWNGPIVVLKKDINSDGIADYIVGAGKDGGPRVVIVDGKTKEEISSRFVFEETLRTGISLAVTRHPPDRSYLDEAVLLAGAGQGGAPRVTLSKLPDLEPLDSYFVGNKEFRDGIDVTLYSDNSSDVVIAPIVIPNNDRVFIANTDAYNVGYGKQLVIVLEIEEDKFPKGTSIGVGFMYDLFYKLIDANTIDGFETTLATSGSPVSVTGYNPLKVRILKYDTLDDAYNNIIIGLENYNGSSNYFP